MNNFIRIRVIIKFYLDTVKLAIQKTDMKSTPGKGTFFIIRLPLD